jgi:hypothetical protein
LVALGWEVGTARHGPLAAWPGDVRVNLSNTGRQRDTINFVKLRNSA